jgi:hypothetical protein
MAVGDVYKLTAVWLTSGAAMAINSWNFRQVDDLIFDTPGEDLVSRFQDEVQAGYAVMVASPYALVRYEVRGQSDPTYGEDFPVTGVPGGVAGEALPFQTAPLISWRTALIGRANRGRTYLPPTGESQASSGVLSSGFLTGMGLFVDAMLAMDDPNVLYAGWELVIWGGTPPSAKPVTAGLPRNLVATQRRRVPGVGS